MDYSQYDVEDFVTDAFFSRWVKRPDDETKVFWEQWMDKHPEKSDTIAQAKSILHILNFRVEEANREEQQEAKTYIMRQINSKQPRKGMINFQKRYLSMAAAIALLLVGSYFIWHIGNILTYQEYATHFGEQREVILPDSTRIKLNANSRLRFKKAWADDLAREVWLEGEAFFEVVKKPEAKDGRFIVHTHELDVEVLGTSFNVEARHGETQVVLNTGKVKLQPANASQEGKTLFLEPGEMATLSQDQLVKTQVNPTVYSAWKDNRLFFENESIEKIAQRLTDTYGYEIQVENEEWLAYKFTGSCPADDISILLVALSESFDFNVTQVNQQIRIQ